MDNIFSMSDNSDYIKRVVEKASNGQTVYSPMDPPDAYKPPSVKPVPYEQLSRLLQHFSDEHKIILSEIEKFENILIDVRKNGISKERNKQLGKFFNFLDDNIVMHHLKEERILFPRLHEILLEKGEHGTGLIPETAVDMLENDHIKTMQLGALIFNLMRISSRLTDTVSRATLLDTAIEQGNALIELLRLHIFREENVVFALAYKYISAVEFKEMEKKMKTYFSVVL